MQKSDNKYKCWMVTYHLGVFDCPKDKWRLSDAHDKLVNIFDKFSDEVVSQIEEHPSKPGSYHVQACIKCKLRKRKQTLLNDFSNSFERYNDVASPIDIILTKDALHVEQMLGTWEQAVLYCSKDDSLAAIGFEYLSKVRYMKVKNPPYKGDDIKLLEDTQNRFPWQVDILKRIFVDNTCGFETPDDRKIIWISDPIGSTGKSKFTKYLTYTFDSIIKIPFGTATQIRTAVATTEKKKVYIVDIPRSLGDDDSLNNIISALEDIKNGYVVSAMYGKMTSLFMEPPHVIVFSNFHCPADKLSADRWIRLEIDPITKGWISGGRVGCY